MSARDTCRALVWANLPPGGRVVNSALWLARRSVMGERETGYRSQSAVFKEAEVAHAIEDAGTADRTLRDLLAKENV